MSLQVEKLEKNMVKITIESSAEKLEEALQSAYLKNRNKIQIHGFRKGKAPRNMIEKLYGADVFYEDAANTIIPKAYEEAVKESDLEIVSQPEIHVTQIEKGKPFIFTALVAIKPEVTLGQYKEIEVKEEEQSVTEEEILSEIDKVREQNAREIVLEEDQQAQEKDEVIIDFEGFLNGEAFEGGKGTDYPLVLGSHSFIDTFEEQLIGKKAQEEAEVHVTFPEEYHAKELAGKPATFHVLIKEIKRKELPELNDTFASDVSEFETLEEYKADVKKKLMERKEKEAKILKEDAVIEKIIENATMEIPDAMVETQIRQMSEEFAQRIQSQGLSVQQYFQLTGTDPKQFQESIRPQALKRIQSRLVLEAIVKAENISISEEEMQAELEKTAKLYQMEVEKFKEILQGKEMEYMRMDLAIQKAIDFVTDSAKAV